MGCNPPPRCGPLPEWWNWQTRQLEGLVPVTRGAGSSPVSGTMPRAGVSGRGARRRGAGVAGIDGPRPRARRWPLRRWDRSGLSGCGRAAHRNGDNTVAGWSSPVARRAHNPKVAGSNPAPATIFRRLSPPTGTRRVASLRDPADIQGCDGSNAARSSGAGGGLSRSLSRSLRCATISSGAPSIIPEVTSSFLRSAPICAAPTSLVVSLVVASGSKTSASPGTTSTHGSGRPHGVTFQRYIRRSAGVACRPMP